MARRITSEAARWLSLVLALCGLLATPAAQAQETGDQMRAKRLFDAALELMDRGSHATACPMLKESLTLDPGMGTKYYLASCYEKIGRLAAAHELLEGVAEDAQAAGQRKRHKHARQAADKLAKRLPKLTVEVPDELVDAGELRITRNREALPRASWGKPVAVDLGEHEIVARQQGSPLAWRHKVWITKERQKVTVKVPVTETLMPSESQLGPTTPDRPADEAPDSSRPSTGQGVDGWVVGGSVSLGVAAVAFIVHIWAMTEVTAIEDSEDYLRYQEGFTAEQDLCEMARQGQSSTALNPPSPSDVASLCDTADDMEMVQAIMLPTSIVAATVGLVLILASDTVSGGDDDDVDVAVQVGPEAASVQLRLQF